MSRKKQQPTATEVSEEPVLLQDTAEEGSGLDLIRQIHGILKAHLESIKLLEERIHLLEDTLSEKEKGRPESITVIL